MKNNIQGVGVALVTPFGNNGDMDFEALGRLVRHVSNNGVDYLVALGTTAETPTLTCEEKDAIIKFIKQENKSCKNLPLVVGIGGNCTREVINSIHKCDLAGIDAVLSVVPYYNKPSQRGIFEHYKVIASESPIPIMLYNVPARTGVNMQTDTTLKLANEVENILGIKEACGSITQMTSIVKGRPTPEFKVISGDDNLTLPLMAIGGDGVISVAANFIPRQFCSIVKDFIDGNRVEAAKMQHRILDAVNALFVEGNPVGVKTALSVKGMMSSAVRLPLVNGSDELVERFKALIERDNL